MIELKCVLHIGNSVSEEIIKPLTTKLLKRLKEKRIIRHKIKQTTNRYSIYEQITLPETIDGLTGYHPACYKGYTSVVDKTESTEGKIELKVSFRRI